MYDKEILIDSICYEIIASFFLIIPYSDSMFFLLIIMLIYDLIELYIIERKEKNENIN